MIEIWLWSSELSRFIASGRLHCTIDKVHGIVETNRPPIKNAQYERVIKEGDLLMNSVQRLSKVLHWAEVLLSHEDMVSYGSRPSCCAWFLCRKGQERLKLHHRFWYSTSFSEHDSSCNGKVDIYSFEGNAISYERHVQASMEKMRIVFIVYALKSFQTYDDKTSERSRTSEKDSWKTRLGKGYDYWQQTLAPSLIFTVLGIVHRSQ